MGAGRVIALPFKEGNLTAMGPSKGQRKELKAMRLPALQHLWPTPTPPISFFDFSKSLENSKNFPDCREYSKYCEYRVKSSNL
jgi:hypothetical protein